MVTQPAYLRNLKAYAKAREETDDDVTAMIADYANESDRGAIILGATQLDDTLEMAILGKMPALQKDEIGRKKMFEVDGPLSTFSSRIEMAYALGLVDEKIRVNMHLLREIRNACAHAKKPLSLSMEILMDPVRAAIADMLPGMKDNEPETIRQPFILKCMILSHGLLTGGFVNGRDEILDLYERLMALLEA